MILSRRAQVLLWVITIPILVLLVAPNLVIIPMSFNAADILAFPPTEYSFRWYLYFLERPEWRAAVRNSFAVAALATLIATSLGTAAALGLVRGRVPMRRAVVTILLTPMIVPSIITAVALYSLYARMGLTGTIWGMSLAHSLLALPLVIINVAAVLQGVDQRIEHAARSLGASATRTFFEVTLPVARPGILAGALFAFITSFDELVVSIFLSGVGATTLPVQMWSGIRFEINPTIAVVSTILIALSALVGGVVAFRRRI